MASDGIKIGIGYEYVLFLSEMSVSILWMVFFWFFLCEINAGEILVVSLD